MIRRSSFTWPVTLAVILLALIVALLVIWIIAQAATQQWALLTVGTIFFTLILIGMVLYVLLTLKEIRLNRRQANFIDSVTHELKSPIASLKLCLQTLDMRAVTAEKQREFHRYMLEDLQRLDNLIDHLLVAARLDSVEPEPAPEVIAVAPVLRGCVEIVQRRHGLADDQISLHTTASCISGTTRDLEIIFLNLLDNAVKYGDKTPRIEARMVDDGRGHISVAISDNGEGISFKLRLKVFQRFYRGGTELERTTKGTGLGLYIVKSLVGKMRGRVQVHGHGPLKGATFEVEFPTVEPGVDPKHESQVTADSGPPSEIAALHTSASASEEVTSSSASRDSEHVAP